MKPGPITYVALGDSTGSGVGATEGGYVVRLFKRIATHRPDSKLINLCVSGATTSEVLHDQLDSAVRADPQLVTLGIGINDIGHGLSLEQCRLATALLRRRDRDNPIRGTSKQSQFRRALRVAGIVSAVRNGRVGNARWARSMVATKGGNAMRDHALHHLRAVSP